MKLKEQDEFITQSLYASYEKQDLTSFEFFLHVRIRVCQFLQNIQLFLATFLTEGV